MTFAKATEVRRSEPDVWAGEVAEGWDILGNANGGYLLGLVGRALVGETAVLGSFGVLAADAFPPTAFNGDLPLGWTPTLELTVHVRRRPAPGWLRCINRTRFVSSGFLEMDGEVWDASGHLVVQSRQLALVPRG
jgi:hypothetical protein